MSKYKPKPLSAESYEAPMEPHWRVMGASEEQRLHAQAIAQHRRFRPFGPRLRGRLLRYVLGSAAGFFVICWFFVSMRLTTCLTFGAVGAAAGTVFCYVRPGQTLGSLLYALFGLAASCAAGLPMIKAMFTMLAFIVVGSAVGIGEDAKRMDFDD